MASPPVAASRRRSDTTPESRGSVLGNSFLPAKEGMDAAKDCAGGRGVLPVGRNQARLAAAALCVLAAEAGSGRPRTQCDRLRSPARIHGSEVVPCRCLPAHAV